MNRKKVEQKVRDVISNLEKLSSQELCEVYSRANAWDWDERMGAKPEGWDGLMLYPKQVERYHRVTRHSYLKQICAYIRNRVSEKELLRYHHIYNLHRTDEEFEMWWRQSGDLKD